MFPPYSGLKIVHDQMIQAELERQRASEAPAPSRPGPSQMLAKALARFTARPKRQPETLLSCNTQRESCTIG
jgi:hypothetical protein